MHPLGSPQMAGEFTIFIQINFNNGTAKYLDILLASPDSSYMSGATVQAKGGGRLFGGRRGLFVRSNFQLTFFVVVIQGPVNGVH